MEKSYVALGIFKTNKIKIAINGKHIYIILKPARSIRIKLRYYFLS